MESNATDKPVPREITALLSDERLILRETQRAVTPFGGIAVFISYLGKIGFVKVVREHMPIRWRSPNQIDPTSTYTAFLLSVLVGARRFAHAGLLRGDRALHALMGLERFPTDDTIRNLFRAFGMGQVQRLYEPLAEWQMQRLPQREDGYTLDLDSTVFERYGQQEGSLKGHNPRKHGRPSHHPLLAVLSEAHFLLHGWLRSGNCGTSRGVEEFLKEALALWGQRENFGTAPAAIHCSGASHPMGKARRPAVEQWTVLDDDYAVGEFRIQLHGWSAERRFVVIREQVREGRDSVGRKLIDVPGYTFRVFVTSCSDPPQEIWRGYNRRADMENRIAELKHDLGADGFCMKQFFATEAAFRAVLLLFNLLAEFQRAAGLPIYRQPATLRTQVLTCGAILGRTGRRLVIHLSESWGGLKTRIPLLDSILNWQIPTSPKLDPALIT